MDRCIGERERRREEMEGRKGGERGRAGVMGLKFTNSHELS